MPIKLTVTTKDSEFHAQLRFATAEIINGAFKRSKGTIVEKARALVRRTMSANPTINELIGGNLQGEFGLTDDLALSVTNDIINIVADGFSIRFDLPKSKRSTTLGTMVLFIDTSVTTAKILGISGSRYKSNIFDVPWLEWLMTKGSQVVVGKYEYVAFLDGGDKSRSGQGFMLPLGGGFRVDPQHAGTIGDNFVTRAIKAVEDDIQQIVTSEIQRAF
jgi:hypothetical protein